MKLWNGIRVLVWKQSCGDGKPAGGYEVQNIDMLSCKAKTVLSGGQPFESAFKEAELLATIIDAEFVLREGISKETILRKSIKGEYYGKGI